MNTKILKKISIVCCFQVLVLSGCKNSSNEIKSKELTPNTYYVKNESNYMEVYMPNTFNLSSVTTKLDQSRVIYFKDDEQNIPDCYVDDSIAFVNNDSDIKNVVFERFEDLGYTIGIVGGTYDSVDGYYHFSVQSNTLPGSQAEQLFKTAESDDIRLISIGDTPINEVLDKESGIISNLKQGEQYTLEFYAGTYYYKSAFVADVHVMRPFEIYNINYDLISDEKKEYKSFRFPEYMKTGYYWINGQGIVRYHDYKSGSAEKNESVNESYYSCKEDVIATYTQQQYISVSNKSDDLSVRIKYGEIVDIVQKNMDIEATITSPSGDVYEFNQNNQNDVLEFNLSEAESGKWEISIIPSSLEIENIEIVGGEKYEETTPYEQEFEFTDDVQNVQFYLTLTGDMDSEIYGVIIGEDGMTYSLFVRQYTDADGNIRRWMHCEVPKLNAGKYIAKINYYKSKNGISEVKYRSYEDGKEEYDAP